MIKGLRDAAWLTPERARAWLLVLAVTLGGLAVGWAGMSRGGVDLLGKPVGTDFVSFWTASELALGGAAADAYRPEVHAAAEGALFPGVDYYAFFYPPVFLLICLPLALLPYMAALAVWLGAGFGVLWACVRRLLPPGWGPLPLLAFPAVLVNASHGQNGFVVAACFAGYALLLRRRPFLAGLCLGALVFKPHLLVAAPVALLAGRRWGVIAGGVLAAGGLAGLSWAVFGGGVWAAFLAAAPMARATLEQGLVPPAKMQSVFAAVLVLHGTAWAGYAAQIAVGAVACFVLARGVWRRPGAGAEAALLVCATPLCTPFLLDYDLVFLAVPLAWLAREAMVGGWRPWEKVAALAAYVLPFVGRPVAMGGVSLAPFVLMGLLVVVWRRALGPGLVLAVPTLTQPLCVVTASGQAWPLAVGRSGSRPTLD